MLTEKQRDAIELYYNEDLSLAEIAQHMLITRQGVQDSIKKAQALLVEYEATLGIVKKFNDISKTVEQIRLHTAQVEELNQRYGSSTEITGQIEKINDLIDQIGM